MDIQRQTPDLGAKKLDLSEKGRGADGQVTRLDRRLFMQLLAFGGVTDTAVLITALEAADIPCTLYEDINDPQGVALLIFHEEADYFVTTLRHFLNEAPFSQLPAKPEYTMMGRTYAIGYEPDLVAALIDRPQNRVCNLDEPWGIWYPLRRAGAFETLTAAEQRVILMEHGGIGRAYGEAGYGRDVRLACYGLDKNDNDFVIGLLGPQLYPLSSIVERMRKTKQTSLYLQELGPFFIGKAVYAHRPES